MLALLALALVGPWVSSRPEPAGSLAADVLGQGRRPVAATTHVTGPPTSVHLVGGRVVAA